MAGKTLRELARDYACGALDEKTYRRERARILDAIDADGKRPPTPDRPAPAATTLRRQLLATAVAIAVVLLALASLLLWVRLAGG